MQLNQIDLTKCCWNRTWRSWHCRRILQGYKQMQLKNILDREKYSRILEKIYINIGVFNWKHYTFIEINRIQWINLNKCYTLKKLHI